MDDAAGFSRRRPLRRAAGFSLLEVLLAMVVVGIAIAGIAQGFAVGIVSAGLARNTTTAAALARARLSEFEAGLRPSDVNADGDFADLGEEEYRWKLVSTAGDRPGLYQLVLTVSWPDRGGERDLTVVRWKYDAQAGAGSNTNSNSSSNGKQ